MPLKLRKKMPVTANPENPSIKTPVEPANVPIPKYWEFLKGWRENSDARNSFGFIREWYERVFGPEENQVVWEYPLAVIRTKIEYELLMRDWKEAKRAFPQLVIPEKIIANWEASKRFDSEALNGMVGHSVRAEIQMEGGTEQMEKQKAKVEKIEKKAIKEAEKKARVTVDGEWLRLLEANFTLKKPDQVLAEEMRKLFPAKKAYEVKDVRRARTVYNSGKLGPQKGIAGPKSVSYDTVEKPKEVVKTVATKTAVAKVANPAQKVTKKKVVLKKKKVVLKKKT